MNDEAVLLICMGFFYGAIFLVLYVTQYLDNKLNHDIEQFKEQMYAEIEEQLNSKSTEGKKVN